MAIEDEFHELQVRVTELERLCKHQGEQLAIHAENVEKHAARLAEAIAGKSVGAGQKSSSTPMTEAARQAAAQGSGGAFS